MMSDVCDNRVTCINVYQVAYISPRFIDYCYINVIVFDMPNIFMLKYLTMRCNARLQTSHVSSANYVYQGIKSGYAIRRLR